jgi:hypothetical protein
MERKEGQGRPEDVPKSQSNSNQPEQQAQGEGIKTPVCQPLPNVWDILERKARSSDEFCRGRMTEGEWRRELDEVEWLKKATYKKGTPRDKHILALLFNRAPGLNLQSELEQIQEWRSLVEQLTDEELAECGRKQKEGIEAFRRGERHQLTFHPSAGDGELILSEHIVQKGKIG